ncbi:MAG: DHHA1 domain-containing protein [Thermoprotei archaeon]|nr:DHHA1 domain-containing protein [Thermoprotei archaeon]
MEYKHAYIVTHADLDGVGAAAAFLRILGVRPGRGATVVYSEPYNIDETLGALEDYVEGGDLLAVTDLGLNEDVREKVVSIVERLVGKGVRVEWYDHHVWSEDDLNSLKKAGALVFVDKSTCATGVVVRYASSVRGVKPDGFLVELESTVCSADLWRWDNSLSPKLFRAVGSREEAREWRDRVLAKFVEGILWDEELEARLQQYVSEELKNMEKIMETVYVKEAGQLKIVAVYKTEGPPANSIVGALLESRYGAHIAGIIRPNGGLSLRSKTVNVQAIAVKLGGGGHYRAAGARINMPVWVKTLSKIYPKIASWYAAKTVAEAVKSMSPESLKIKAEESEYW